MNKLLNDDCQKILPKIESNFIDLVIADPPYGISYQSAWRTESKRFDVIANDSKPFIEWIPEAGRILKNDGALVCFCRWDVQQVFKQAINEVLPVRSQVIWDRDIHGLGDLKRQFAPRHDVIWFAAGDGFEFPGKRPVSVIKSRRVSSGKLVHPNEKPAGLIKALINFLSVAGDTILDPFMGSGVTGVCAGQMKRNFIGIELNRHYFEVARKRIEMPAQDTMF